MRRTRRRRKSNNKPVPETAVTNGFVEKPPKTKQTDISKYFTPIDKNDTVPDVDSNERLPEGSLPSPDDAALPCSTKLSSISSKSSNGDEKGAHKESDALSSSKKKQVNKNPKPLNNTQLTDFFPVRRSNRKPLQKVKKEKRQIVEEAILSGKEDGFEIKDFPGKGRGVITNKLIKRGDFVMEYFGELIDYDEAVRREKIYADSEDTGCYMYYFTLGNKRYCVDATKESGRLGRLINHSKKGNLKTQPLRFKENPHLALFACKDIEPGEELCYDYGDRSKQALESYPWLAL